MAGCSPHDKSSAGCPAALALVLDSSESIEEDGWQKTLTFATDIVEGLRRKETENLSSAENMFHSSAPHRNLEEYMSGSSTVDTHISVVVYSSSATTHWGLDSNKSTEQLVTDIHKLQFQHRSTNTFAGLLHAERAFQNSPTLYSKHIVVLITDGQSDDQEATVSQAEKMHDNGVEIFVIGVGDVNKDEMDQVGSKPVEVHCQYVPDHTAMVAITEAVVQIAVNAVKTAGVVQTLAAAPPMPHPPPPRIDGFRVLNELMYWRDVRKSGLVCGSLVTLLFSLMHFSVLTVLPNFFIAVLAFTVPWVAYKRYVSPAQDQQHAHPFQAVLEYDVSMSEAHADAVRRTVNTTVIILRRLLLVEDMMATMMFLLVLWMLMYVGAWFNGLTVIFLVVIGLFTMPKFYADHRIEIDPYMEAVKRRINGLLANPPGLADPERQ